MKPQFKRSAVQRAISAPLAVALSLQGLWLFAPSAQAQSPAPAMLNISQTPLTVSGGGTPNVLMVLDTSSSMDDKPDGTPGIPTDPASKSYIARTAARTVVSTYGANTNLGLASYDQTYDNYIIESMKYNAYAFISFNPANYNSGCTGNPPGYVDPNVFPVPAPSATGCENASHAQLFSPINPSYPNFYYNTRFNGYNAAIFDGENKPYYYYLPLKDTTGNYYWITGQNQTTDQPTQITCGGGSIPGFPAYPKGSTYNPKGAVGNCVYWGAANDSGGGGGALGMWMAVTPLGNIWNGQGNYMGGGAGWLHVPIAKADAGSAQATALNKKLALETFSYGTTGGTYTPLAMDNMVSWDDPKVNWDDANHSGWRNPNYPLLSVGETPIQGTLVLANNYFNGTPVTASYPSLGTASLTTAQTQGACINNYVVFLTDGLPSVRYPSGYASDSTTYGQASLNAGVVSAAKDLLQSAAKVKTFFIGFGADFSSTSAGVALTSFAQAGGTDTPYAADSAASLQAAFDTIFTSIQVSSMGLSPVATNSSSLTTDSMLYQSLFDPSSWTGHMSALPINADGTVGAATWDAAAKFPAAANRNIVTYTDGAGAKFLWSAINTTQQTQLGSADVLNWLRGTNGSLRARANPLGDVVNSAPVYVGNQAQMSYSDTIEPNVPYSAWSTSTAVTGRTPMVYVGANDGMLHGFNATTSAAGGTENFAYVPNVLYPKLAPLSAANYTHQFYVDGTPTIVDACLNTASPCGWNTVLAGGLNAGGKGIYALNVTNPANMGPGNVMWEFTDANDPDLGYTFSAPQIVKLRNYNHWVAIFGNGYNSANTGDAVLYVVDLNTGTLIQKIDAGLASAAGKPDPANGNKANGLSTPAVVSNSSDNLTDYAFAGDLRGNLWKFDLSDASPANWTVAYGAPLYTAVSASGVVQPITTQPEVARHPQGGFLVYFGTGKSFEVGDNALTTPNTFYGIWDNNAAITTGRTKLVQETITDEPVAANTGGTGVYRLVSNNTIDWTVDQGWYMDLPDTGERLISDPQLNNGRIIFVTTVPTASGAVGASACVGGGSSWLMELDPLNGGELDQTPFDTNGDGVFSSNDMLLGADGKYHNAGGMQVSGGMASAPSIINNCNGAQCKLMNTSSGTVTSVKESSGAVNKRLSWRDASQTQ